MKRIFLVLLISILTNVVNGQTSSNNGPWTTASNWSGGSVPNGWTTINVGHTMTRTGNYNVEGTLNVQSAGTLTLTGNVTVTGGSAINVYGNLTITGNLTLNGRVNVFPGGTITVNGSVYVNDSDYLTIGTAVASPPFAQMIIKQDLVSQGGGGDILVRRNGRLAVFGNFSGGSAGGTLLTLDSGGMVYVNGTTTFTGGGDHLTNNNTTSPWGFYSNNNPTYSGGGSNSNGAAGANSVKDVNTMQTEAGDFYSWVSGIPTSPLPIKLLYFKVDNVSGNGVYLKWATTMEKNFDKFLIERAGENLNWQVIGEITGKGGLDITTSYDLLDKSPATGKNYYRLKSVDFDRTFEYSNVVYTFWNFKTENIGIAVYPNPVVNHTFTLKVNGEIPSYANMTLLNGMGREVMNQSLVTNNEVISLQEDLKPGIYFLKISGTDFNRTIKVLIQ